MQSATLNILQIWLANNDKVWWKKLKFGRAVFDSLGSTILGPMSVTPRAVDFLEEQFVRRLKEARKFVGEALRGRRDAHDRLDHAAVKHELCSGSWRKFRGPTRMTQRAKHQSALSGVFLAEVFKEHNLHSELTV